MKKRKIVEVTTHQAKSTLSKLLRQVEESSTVVRISRGDLLVAELRSLDKVRTDLFSPPLKFSKIKFNEDPSLPVDSEDWPDEYR